MSRSKRPTEPPGRDPDPTDEPLLPEEDFDPRPHGPLESVFQEIVRRTAMLGFSGFFLTEGAIRKALTDSLPRDWVEYASRQSEEVRGELTNRLVDEFGSWLRNLDLASLLKSVLEDHEFSATIEISAHRKNEDPATSLKIVTRRK